MVPSVPTFAVDQGFWYSIPPGLAGILQVGSIVRVPLSGRRVRGWVVEIGERPPGRLKDVTALSGAAPVFGPDLARSLNWAAGHYVAPVSVVLAKATPPNLPGEPPGAPSSRPTVTVRPHPLAAVAQSSAEGRRFPPQAMVGRWQGLEWLDSLTPVLVSGGSVMVVAATGAEVAEISHRAGPQFPERVVTVPHDDAAAVTRAWERAQGAGLLVVGTPRVAMWQVKELTLVVVLEEGRRAMKDRQTPTIHVREMIRTRSRVEGFNAVFFGPTPSVELLAAGAGTVPVGRRAWGLVEVVDRSTERPGGGFVSETVTVALRSVALEGGERAFVLAGQKITPAVVDEVNARLGGGTASPHPGPAPVTVGSERDLAGLDPVSLTVAVDIDFMAASGGYRGTEEALRQLARLGNVLRPGRGRRMMVQTREPGSDLARTLRRGDPVPYLERVLIERARGAMPPAREMIAIEVRGDPPHGLEADLEDLGPVDLYGPMPVESGRRWLLAGDLARVRSRLRTLAARWRDRGATVRIDADPIDL